MASVNVEEIVIPFLEQIKLFVETMDERFIKSKEIPEGNGKCLLVLALDADEKNNFVKNVCHCYGGEYELAFTLAKALRNEDFIEILKNASVIEKIAKREGFQID